MVKELKNKFMKRKMFIFFPKCLHVVKSNIRINNILKIAQIIPKQWMKTLKVTTKNSYS